MKRIKIHSILLAVAVLLASAPKALASSETATPQIEEATTEILYTPEPEPDILDAGSRGETVARIQRRLKDLGYYHYKPTGYFISMTELSLQAFQEANGLSPDASVGDDTLDALFSDYPVRKNTSSIPGYQAPTYVEPTRFGEAMDWQQVTTLIPDGANFVVHDLYSNLSCNMQRSGGNHHMEVEPVGAEDTTNLSAMFSKIISGEKRTVLVEYEGQYIAASLYGAGHGTERVKENEAEGHNCLYFSGSVAETSLMPDVEHQKNIETAAGN